MGITQTTPNANISLPDFQFKQINDADGNICQKNGFNKLALKPALNERGRTTLE